MAVSIRKRSSASQNSSDVPAIKSRRRSLFLTHYGRSATEVIFSGCIALLFLFGSQTVVAQAPAPPAQRSSEESPNDLFVKVGKSVIVSSAVPVERVSVGFGDFAEASAIG